MKRVEEKVEERVKERVEMVYKFFRVVWVKMRVVWRVLPSIPHGDLVNQIPPVGLDHI